MWPSPATQLQHTHKIFVQRKQAGSVTFVMADGGNNEAERSGGPLWRLTTRCPGVLFGKGRHCLSAHFHWCQQHSSLERMLPCSQLRHQGKHQCTTVITRVWLFSLSSLWHPCCGSLWQLVEVQVSCASWPSTIEVMQKAKEGFLY